MEETPLTYLTFDEFRWAVSCVMSRQNNLPQGELGMIPGFDSCNHSPTGHETYYNMETDCSETFASYDIAKGDEITM